MKASSTPVHMRSTVLEWKSAILPPVTLWFTTTEGDWCFDQYLELHYTPETLREQGHLILWKKQHQHQHQEERHRDEPFIIPEDTDNEISSKVTFRLSDLQAVQRHVFAAPVYVAYNDKLTGEKNDLGKKNNPPSHSSRYKLSGAVGLVLSWQYGSKLFFVFHNELETDKWEKALQLVLMKLKKDNEKITSSPMMEQLDASLDPPCQGQLLMRRSDARFQHYYVIPSKYMKGSLHQSSFLPNQMIYLSRHRSKWVLQVQKSLGLGIPQRIDLQYTTIREDQSDDYLMFLDVEPYIPNWRSACNNSSNREKDSLTDRRSIHAKRYECMVSSIQEKREWQKWFRSHGAVVIFASDVSRDASPVVQDDDLLIPSSQQQQQPKSILKKPVVSSAWSVLSGLVPARNTVNNNNNNNNSRNNNRNKNNDYIIPNDIHWCNSSTMVLPLHEETNRPSSSSKPTENDFSETTEASGKGDDFSTSIVSTAIHNDENGIDKEKLIILEDTPNEKKTRC